MYSPLSPIATRRLIFSIFAAIALLAASQPAFAAPAAAPAAPEASADCNIWWTEPLHDTFDSNYRSIVGPTTPNNTVKLRLRTAQSDLTSARLRVWDDRANTQTYHNLAWDAAYDTDPTTYDWWYVDLPVGNQPTILYYFFELNDAPGWCGADQDFYTDDDPKFYGGGRGAMSDGYNDALSFQITVYDPAFDVPEWMSRAVVYQIFPDRFRDGETGNNPVAGRFSYDMAGGAIVRSNQSNWNYTVCDPRSTYSPSCADKYGDNFYGGDLAGITEKINAGYFDSIGITALYLNPVFRSPSNHKYDTADYLTIDPDFGTPAEFQALVAAADAHGIRIILDGVFNHVSSDSKYFDRYSRFDADGNLTSLGIGSDDQSGACESPNNDFRAWFYIPDSGSPATGPNDRCDSTDDDDPGGAWTLTYSAWYGYGSLPKLQANSTEVRGLIWADGLNSVGPYWVSQGADGWRFDVGGDVDPGLTNDPANDYWEGFRAATRGVNADTITLGEEWADATAWLLGNEWDSVMNYRFRSALLSWLFTGCVGGSNGCNPSGTVFEDNDSNAGSASGSISYISPSQFNARLRSIQEDYPPMAWKAMMNLAGSHDTNRLRFLLLKSNNDSDAAAVQRMKEAWIFTFTYAGAPTLYYGDEVGLSHNAVWANSKWEDDPYNRAPFPWGDTGGSYTADTANLLAFARKMASIRHAYRALQDGDVQHGIIIDDANKIYGFARTNGSQTALIALNRDSASHNVTFSGLNSAPYNLPDGTTLYEAIEGNLYTVSGGSVSAPVNASWGIVLLEQDKMDTPNAPVVSMVADANSVTLSWPQVNRDTGNEPEVVTAYQVWRSPNPDFSGATIVQTVSPADFGVNGNLVSYTEFSEARPGNYYYRVAAFNSGAESSADSNQVGVTPTAVLLTGLEGNPAPVSLWLAGALLLAALLGLGWMAARRPAR